MRHVGLLFLTAALLSGCGAIKSITGIEEPPKLDTPSKQFAAAVGSYNAVQDMAIAYVKSGKSTAAQRIIIREADEAATRLIETTDKIIDAEENPGAQVIHALRELNTIIAQIQGILDEGGER